MNLNIKESQAEINKAKYNNESSMYKKWNKLKNKVFRIILNISLKFEK